MKVRIETGNIVVPVLDNKLGIIPGWYFFKVSNFPDAIKIKGSLIWNSVMTRSPRLELGVCYLGYIYRHSGDDYPSIGYADKIGKVN